VSELTKSATSTSTVATASTASTGGWVFCLGVFLNWVIVQGCHDHLRSKFWASDLNEGMLMSETVLAYLAVVKVHTY
jgi:hypothetical protein